MRLVTLPVRVWDFCAAPVAKQKGFATGSGVKLQNRLPMMLFHDHDQVCPAQVFWRELGGPMRCQVNALCLHHAQRGFICRMVDQGTHTS